MDVARLNFSHGTQEEHARTLADVRAAARELRRPVGVLQDLAGPKVRVGMIAEGPVMLKPDQTFALTTRDVAGDETEVSLGYKDLPGDVKAGDCLLLSDGALELVVEEVDAQDIRCRVITGGELSSRKGINLPGRSIRARFPTEKDVADLRFGLEQGVDFVGMSFIRSAADVEVARTIVTESGGGAWLIAKVEKHEALAEIDAIMDVVDGVMIARGDLGVEVPIEHVPRLQKTLIETANRWSKPVITATQMLRSMVENPRPTRAEVTDVANAILDGSDAIMLSEETAVGKYPVQAVEMMARIATDTEASLPHDAWSRNVEQAAPLRPQEAVAHAARMLAEKVGAAAIITCTQSGSTTRLVAKYRPNVPIVAITPDEVTYRRLAMLWGTTPLMMAAAEDSEAMERQAVETAVEAGCVQAGQTVVLTAGVPLHVPGTTNMMKVLTVG